MAAAELWSESPHLLAPNHGKVCKSLLLAYLPDWEARAAALKAWGAATQI